MVKQPATRSTAGQSLAQLLFPVNPHSTPRRDHKIAKHGAAPGIGLRADPGTAHAPRPQDTYSTAKDVGSLGDAQHGAMSRSVARQILKDMANLGPINFPKCLGGGRKASARAPDMGGAPWGRGPFAFEHSNVLNTGSLADAMEEAASCLQGAVVGEPSNVPFVACYGDAESSTATPSSCADVLDDDSTAGAQEPAQMPLDLHKCGTRGSTGFTDRSDGLSDELRADPNDEKPILWKVRLCAKFMHSDCTSGAECPFAHGARELRKDAERDQECMDRLQGFILPAIRPYISTQEMVQRHKTRPDDQGLLQHNLDRSIAPNVEQLRHKSSSAPVTLCQDWLQLYLQRSPRDIVSIPDKHLVRNAVRTPDPRHRVSTSSGGVTSVLSSGMETFDGTPGPPGFPSRIQFPAALPQQRITVSSGLQGNAMKLATMDRSMDKNIIPLTTDDGLMQHGGRHRIKVETITANPHDVLFANLYIMDRFSCGRSVEATIDELSSGQISVNDIPKIRVVWRHGKLVTLDHRRLYAFRAALPLDAEITMKLVLSDVLADQFLPSGATFKSGVGVQKF